jgi:hypothetical protein
VWDSPCACDNGSVPVRLRRDPKTQRDLGRAFGRGADHDGLAYFLGAWPDETIGANRPTGRIAGHGNYRKDWLRDAALVRPHAKHGRAQCSSEAVL